MTPYYDDDVRWKSIALLLFFPIGAALAQESSGAKGWSLHFYGGPSTKVPLVEIIRFSVPTMEPYSILSVGATRALGTSDAGLRWEVETGLTKHLERANLFSLSAAIGARWLRPPWHQVFPGSFYFANGLSLANGEPGVEVEAIGRTNRLLYHIILEYEFRANESSRWSFFFRDHHRSGAYGLFNGITGGSDFLCLGIRRSF